MRTALTELAGVKHPVVQTGMGWVAGPRLVSATAEHDRFTGMPRFGALPVRVEAA